MGPDEFASPVDLAARRLGALDRDVADDEPAIMPRLGAPHAVDQDGGGLVGLIGRLFRFVAHHLFSNGFQPGFSV